MQDRRLPLLVGARSAQCIPSVVLKRARPSSQANLRRFLAAASVCCVEASFAQVPGVPDLGAIPPGSTGAIPSPGETTGPTRPGGAPPLGPNLGAYGAGGGFGAVAPTIGLRAPDESVGRGWVITPSIGARLTLRDNVKRPIDVDSNVDGSIDVFPGIAIRGGTPRLRLSLAYVGQKTDYFRDQSRNRWANNLGASATIEAIERFFYIDTSAAITQQFFSTLGPRFEDTSGDFANRFESRAASVSPYIASRIGENIPYTVRYNQAWSTGGSNRVDVPSSTTQQIVARIEGPIPSSAGWSLDYNQNRIEWENQPNRLDFGRYFGTLYYRLAPEITVSALAGQEFNNFERVDKAYTNYGAGLTWRPTPRTSLDGLAERRFFGTGYRGRIAHRHRDVSFSVGASRDITFFQERLFALPAGDVRQALDTAYLARFPDPVQRAAEVSRTISTFGLPAVSGIPLTYFTQRVLLQKQVDSTLVWLGVRNTLALNLFWRDVRPIDAQSQALAAEDFASLSDSRQTGVNLTLVHRLSGSTFVSGRLGRIQVRSRSTTLTNPDSTQDDFTATIVTQVGPRTQLYSGLRILRLDSTINPDILERSVFGGFAHTFQ